MSKILPKIFIANIYSHPKIMIINPWEYSGPTIIAPVKGAILFLQHKKFLCREDEKVVTSTWVIYSDGPIQGRLLWIKEPGSTKLGLLRPSTTLMGSQRYLLRGHLDSQKYLLRRQLGELEHIFI